jgi:hypothetical protein
MNDIKHKLETTTTPISEPDLRNVQFVPFPAPTCLRPRAKGLRSAARL